MYCTIIKTICTQRPFTDYTVCVTTMSIGRLERNAGRLLNRPAIEEDVDQFMDMNNKQMLRDRYDYSQQQKKNDNEEEYPPLPLTSFLLCKTR